MHKIWIIIQREYTSRVKNKRFLLVTFLVPLLMVGLIVGSAYFSFKGTEERKIAVVDPNGFFKDKLKNRKIKKYTDNDWWKYGAVRNLENMLSNKNRIYVAPKTRLTNPFFLGQSNELYSGSLLGIFPKKDNIDLEKSITFFNSDIFKNRLKQFFIMIEDKFNFTPSVLGKIPLNLNEII